MWQAYDNKLEKSIQLNMHCIELIQSQKIKSKLKALFIFRIIEGASHLVIIYYLIKFFIANILSFSKFTLLLIILLIFFVVCFINCVGQLITIKQVDYSENIADIQRKLSLLNTHIVNYMRLPFGTAATGLSYYWF